MRVDSGVAGERRDVGVPKFNSWCKCTMPLTNINSDWMSNALSGLCYIVFFPVPTKLGKRHRLWTPARLASSSSG